MTIRAVVFDIGGVLEIAPPNDWIQRWNTRLGRDVEVLLADVFRAGTLGTISEAEVEERIEALLGLDRAQRDAFMEDLWSDYLGELNVELTQYFASLRPRYRTGILSNSFVGAREREQARYGFADLCDLVIYSHEEGTIKPDRRFFELAFARLDVQPDEMVFLDDVLGHVTAARALGVHAILFTENAEAIPRLRALLDA